MHVFHPDITALARSIGRSDPDDTSEQAVNLRRIQELRSAMTEGPAAGLGWCLEAAATLAGQLARPGEMPRETLMRVVLQLVAVVEKGYGELLEAESDAEPEPPREEPEPETDLGLDLEPALDVVGATDGPLPLINDMVLGEIMVQMGGVDRRQVKKALRLQVTDGDRIGRILVRLGACSPEQVQNALRLQRHLRDSAGPGEPAAAGAGLRTSHDALLGEILMQLRSVTPDQMAQALQMHRASGIRVGEALVQLGAASWTDVESAARMQNELRFVSGLDAPDRSVA